jgi:hypothetical protein
MHQTTITTLSSGVEYYDRYEYGSGDSQLWLDLFAMADAAAGEKLATTLEIIRNTGARLVQSGQFGYRIEPVFGVQGFADELEYEEQRKYLREYGEILVGLLKRLGRKGDG